MKYIKPPLFKYETDFRDIFVFLEILRLILSILLLQSYVNWYVQPLFSNMKPMTITQSFGCYFLILFIGLLNTSSSEMKNLYLSFKKDEIPENYKTDMKLQIFSISILTTIYIIGWLAS